MLSEGVPSNKTVKGLDGDKKTWKINDKNGCGFLEPVPDKISICLSISDSQDQIEIEETVWAAAKDPDSGVEQASGLGRSYRTHLKMRLPKPGGGYRKENILVQAHPYLGSRPFFRLEWNPSRAGPAGHQHLHDRLSQLLPGGPWQLVEDGRVSRVDVAVDLSGIGMEELLIHVRRKRTRHLYVGQDGSVETIYYGSQRGNQVVAYDRARRLEALGIEPPIMPLTRVETRIKTGVQFSDLSSLKNPLTGISVTQTAIILPPDEDHHFALFLAACRLHGTKHAMQLLPPKLRPSYQAAMSGCGDELWQPTEIWSRWPSVLDALGLYPHTP